MGRRASFSEQELDQAVQAVIDKGVSVSEIRPSAIMREMGHGSYDAIAKALPAAFKRLGLLQHTSSDALPSASITPEGASHDEPAYNHSSAAPPEVRITKQSSSKATRDGEGSIHAPETAPGSWISQGVIEEAARRMASEIISEFRKAISGPGYPDLVSEIRKLQDQVAQLATSHATASGVDGSGCKIDRRLDGLQEQSRLSMAKLNQIQHHLMDQDRDLVSRTVAQQDLHKTVGRIEVDMARLTAEMSRLTGAAAELSRLVHRSVRTANDQRAAAPSPDRMAQPTKATGSAAPATRAPAQSTASKHQPSAPNTQKAMAAPQKAMAAPKPSGSAPLHKEQSMLHPKMRQPSQTTLLGNTIRFLRERFWPMQRQA